MPKISQRLYDEAFRWYGEREVEGNTRNPTIYSWIAWALPWYKGDDGAIAWCAIFMGVLFRNIGLSSLIPDKLYRARSWLAVGYSVPLSEIKQGDIVIFWRGRSDDGVKGHVTLYSSGKLLCLGGNQSDQVGINKYRAEKVLDVRRIDPSSMVNTYKRFNKLESLLLKIGSR